MGKYYYPTAEVKVEEISTITTEHNSSQSFADQSQPQSHSGSSSNDIYVHVYIAVGVACLAILVGILCVVLYRKRKGKNLHLCTERPINQSLEGNVDVPLEQSADRDNQEMHEDNKANTSATLLLGADADTSV